MSNPSLFSIQRKHLTSFSVHNITVLLVSPLWQDVLQRSLFSFRRPYASLHNPIHARSHITPILRGSPSFSHSSSSPPSRRHSPSHHETTSGTSGVEGATAAAHRRAEDVSAPTAAVGAHSQSDFRPRSSQTRSKPTSHPERPLTVH